MARYIDFEIAREYLHKACESLGGNGGLMLKIKFDEEPKADVVEVVHGEWIDKHIGMGTCSRCNYRTTRYNYCPCCGARMDGEK